MTPTQLGITITDMSSRYDRALGRLEGLQETAAKDQDMLNTITHNLELWAKTQILLTKTAEFAREQTVRQIESLVTSALRAIIDDEELSFRVNLDTRGGSPTADWRIVKHADGKKFEVAPEDTDDGGVLDVVYMALYLSIAGLTETGDIWMDEPGKCVSARYSVNLAYFLKQYAAKMNRRIILVTHNDALAEAADLGYRVTQANGKSEVKRLAC